MNILESIRSRAAKLHKTVVLPEGDEERNQQAAAIMASLDMAPGTSAIAFNNGIELRRSLPAHTSLLLRDRHALCPWNVPISFQQRLHGLLGPGCLAHGLATYNV